MVRAAFEGDGRISIDRGIDSGGPQSWRATRARAAVEIANNRRSTKLRFPQGSEVWITVCPKFGTTAKSGLTNPEVETELPEPRRWRAVSGFPRS